MAIETWKPIAEFDGAYEASSRRPHKGVDNMSDQVTAREIAEAVVNSMCQQHGYRAGYKIVWDDEDHRAWVDAITAALTKESTICLIR